MTRVEALALIADRCRELGIDVQSVHVERHVDGVHATVRFLSGEDLAAFAALDRAKVDVVSKLIPSRYIEHSALYDRGELRWLLRYFDFGGGA